MLLLHGVVLDRLVVLLVKKFPAIYGNQIFVVFTRAHHWTLS